LFCQKLTLLSKLKPFAMGSLSLLSLITILQYALFGGIVLVLFGWFEKKEKLTYAGQTVFILSGLFAMGILLTNTINVQPVEGAAIPKEMKILSLLKLMVWFAGLNFVSIVFRILKTNFYKASLIVVILAALGLFFIAFNLLQMPVK
jgi:hypothetical protein